MVLSAVKPKKLLAVICKVDVRKGGFGELLWGFVSIDLIKNSEDFNSDSISLTSFSEGMGFFFKSSSLHLISSASKIKSLYLNLLDIGQYSSLMCLSLSVSLSQIILKEGDWTLPADLAGGACLQTNGDTLNPIRWSKILLAKYASTKSWSISLGEFIACFIADEVISLKVILLTSLSFNNFFSEKSESKCHAIASPSLSGSVAK